MIAEATTPGKFKFGLGLTGGSEPLLKLGAAVGGTTYFAAGGTIAAAETFAYPATPKPAPTRGFSVQMSQQDGLWFVLDRASGIFGSGDTPQEAVDDFRQATRDHLEMLEEEDALSEPLRWQLDYLRARLR